jgi:hypothetical protein
MLRYSYALNGRPYTIHFFLGSPPADSEVGTQFHKHPSHVGMVYTFSTQIANEDDSSGRCANCAKQKTAGILSRAQLHLTSPLVKHALDSERVHIRNLTREQVAGYLKDMLQWKAVDVSRFYVLLILLTSCKKKSNVGIWSSPRHSCLSPSDQDFRNGWDWQARRRNEQLWQVSTCLGRDSREAWWSV